MALVESLLSAIVRADGDALVMHVGERPYVVAGTATINISTHGLTLEMMTGMLSQLLPADGLVSLEEFGAVEHRLNDIGDDRFNCVAARGGDDIWIEIRRRRNKSDAAVAARPPEPFPILETAAPPVAAPIPAHVAAAEAAAEEARRRAAEAAAEERRLVAEAAAVEEERRLAEAEEAAVQEERRLAAEAAAIEERRRAAEAAEAEQRRRVAEAAAEGARRLAAEAAAAEERRVAAQAAAEEQQRSAAAEAAAAVEEERRRAEAAAEEQRRRSAEAAALQAALEKARALVPEFTAPEPPQPDLMAGAAVELIDDDPPYAQEGPVELRRGKPIEQVDEPAVEPTMAAEIIPTPPLPVTEVQTKPLEAASAPEPDELRRAEPVEPVEPAVPAGVLLPMTRTVRIEVPPRIPASRSSDIERLLRIAAARGASALFLTSESCPHMRVDGDIRQLENEAMLTRSDVEAAIVEIAPETARQSNAMGEATEWLKEYPELGRIRCTTFTDHRGPGLMLRMIATRAATAEQLGLSREVQALATEPQGLVLVAGPRASGKSTLMSALVDLVNRQRAEFVITLERQIRLVHDNKAALVSQREIRGGADEALAAARSALREGPDVLVVDDLISAHMVPLLLTAASEGRLVFVSIASPSTTDAVQRFVELAAPEMRSAVQSAMAESFRGAVAQVLLKKTGGGLVAAREVLLATAPVSRVIGEGQLAQLPHALESGRKHGMVSFAETLIEYVRSGTVDVREAFRKAPDRDRLMSGLKREGIDTSLVERLA